MTAATRKTAVRPSAIEIFVARAEARAMVWQAGEFDLHEAIDVLHAAAERDELIAAIGQDEVQRLMTEPFAQVRKDAL
jgi:hypothetical protein